MILLLFPGSSLDVLWKLKSETQRALAAHPFWAIALMLVVACACGGAAVGLARCAEWGRRVAIGVLVANLIGDTLNAFVRSNWRTLVGLPIGGLLIFYLLRARTARHFRG